jgi:hypothetical protein
MRSPGAGGSDGVGSSVQPLIQHAVRLPAGDCALWRDPVWITDSTPVECVRSRETVHRSHLAGWAGYARAPARP